MSLLFNIIWIVTVGWISALGWLVAGVLQCLTIVGIPLAVMSFKMAALTLAPFGREVTYGGGAPSFLLNLIWLLLGGVEMALAYVLAGLVLCVTVVGIPFGVQLFKMAKLSLMPFGTTIG